MPGCRQTSPRCHPSLSRRPQRAAGIAPSSLPSRSQPSWWLRSSPPACCARAATTTAPPRPRPPRRRRRPGRPPTSITDPALELVAGIPQNGTVLGKSGTTVRLLQFEDLQCPICKRYTDEAFPAIVNEYVRTGRIKVDFRGLAFLGPDSLKALQDRDGRRLAEQALAGRRAVLRESGRRELRLGDRR